MLVVQKHAFQINQEVEKVFIVKSTDSHTGFLRQIVHYLFVLACCDLKILKFPPSRLRFPKYAVFSIKRAKL